MELEFDYRQRKEELTQLTGWEYERELLENQVRQSAHTQGFTPKSRGRKLTDEILHNLKFLEKGVNEDDELETIAHLAALTALSFAGVYILLDTLSRSNQDEINDGDVIDYIDELKQEPENCIEYEDEQEQGFTMTMM